MAAADLLDAERELAAKRKSKGASKGNLTKKATLGTNSVPSDNAKPPRAPRATEIIAKQENVPRDKLAQADKVRKADPKLAVKVSTGEVSLHEAAVQAGLPQSKKKRPPKTQVKPMPLVIDNEPIFKDGVLDSPTAIFRDDWTSIVDDANGIRIVRSRQCTTFTDKAGAHDVFVFAKQQRWAIEAAEATDVKLWKSRDKAEARALALLCAAIDGTSEDGDAAPSVS